jgi:hypothetical protein
MSSWLSMVTSCTPIRYDLLFAWIYLVIICSVHISKAILAVRSEYFEALLYDGPQDFKQVGSFHIFNTIKMIRTF